MKGFYRDFGHEETKSERAQKFVSKIQKEQKERREHDFRFAPGKSTRRTEHKQNRQATRQGLRRLF